MSVPSQVGPLKCCSDLGSIVAKLDDILGSQETAKEVTSKLSVDLELQTGKILERLDAKIESLAKQLAEKAEENGMVSTLYKRKEAACERHEKEIAELRETAEKQAQQIQELEANLLAMDAAQEENEETIRRLETVGTEADSLREELKSRTAAMADLQSTLDLRDREYASQVQNLSSNILKLAQSVQEKEQSSRIAAQQAAEIARREVQIEMERVNEETKKALQEAEKQRNHLAGQLEIFMQKIQEKEQNECRDSSTIRSLQERLATAEAAAEFARQELAQNSAHLRQLESSMTSTIKNLEAELENSKKRASELEGENERQRQNSQVLISGLKSWALHQGVDINGLDSLNDCNRTTEEIGAGLVRTLEQLSLSQRSRLGTKEESSEAMLLHGESSRFFMSESGLLPRPEQGMQANSSKTVQHDMNGATPEHPITQGDTEIPATGDDPASYPAALHHMRRVVVRSPANVPNEPVPPSIKQEKMRRREASKPKSIMKRVTRSTSGVLKHERTDPPEKNDTLVRSSQDRTLIDTPISTEPRHEPPNIEVSTASSPDFGEIANKASSRGSTKRRRPDTTRSNDPVDQPGSLKQAKTQETTKSNHGLPATGQQKEPGGRRRQKTSNTDGTRIMSATPASQYFHRTPSMTASQVPGPKQPLRTYGSQKAGESAPFGEQVDSRFSMRTRSQSRYLPKSKESQESVTFSQDGADAGDGFPIPFPN